MTEGTQRFWMQWRRICMALGYAHWPKNFSEKPEAFFQRHVHSLRRAVLRDPPPTKAKSPKDNFQGLLCSDTRNLKALLCVWAHARQCDCSSRPSPTSQWLICFFSDGIFSLYPCKLAWVGPIIATAIGLLNDHAQEVWDEFYILLPGEK